MFNYCKEHSSEPSLCINQFITINNISNENSHYLNQNVRSYIKIVPYDKVQPDSILDSLKIRKAYNVPFINNMNTAKKVIITIIIPYHHPNLKKDLHFVSNLYKLPKPIITIFNLGSNSNSNSNWNYEANLDVQMCYIMNPYAHIRVIEAASANLVNIFNAIKFANNRHNFGNKLDTDIISMSFGAHDTGGYPDLTNITNNPNICYLAASGDNQTPSYPSTCPNIMSIGATYLQLDVNNNRILETLWQDSGCGLSPSFSKPTYQIGNAENVIGNTSTQRSVPDLCAIGSTASPIIIYINGKPIAIAGTSVAAPLVAGLLSLVVQERFNSKHTKPLNTIQKQISNSIQLQSVLYQNINTPNYTNLFYDITSGSSNGYSAGLEYDIASGLGVLNIQNVINYLKNL